MAECKHGQTSKLSGTDVLFCNDCGKQLAGPPPMSEADLLEAKAFNGNLYQKWYEELMAELYRDAPEGRNELPDPVALIRSMREETVRLRASIQRLLVAAKRVAAAADGDTVVGCWAVPAEDIQALDEAIRKDRSNA